MIQQQLGGDLVRKAKHPESKRKKLRKKKLLKKLRTWNCSVEMLVCGTNYKMGALVKYLAT